MDKAKNILENALSYKNCEGLIEEDSRLEDAVLHAINEALNQESWSDDKVIDFVNWYIEVHQLDFIYTLENRNIIESFKNGDDASKWHCR